MSAFKSGARMTFRPRLGQQERSMDESSMSVSGVSEASFVYPQIPSPVADRARFTSRTLSATTPGNQGRLPGRITSPQHTPRSASGQKASFTPTPRRSRGVPDEDAGNVTLLNEDGGETTLPLGVRADPFDVDQSELFPSPRLEASSYFARQVPTGSTARPGFSSSSAAASASTSFMRGNDSSFFRQPGTTSGATSFTGVAALRSGLGFAGFARQEATPITLRFREAMESPSEPFDRVAEYKEICDAQIDSLDQNLTLATGKFQRAVDEMKLMKAERDTWLLVHMVFQDRFSFTGAEDDMAVSTIGLSDRDIAGNLLARDVDTRAADLVVRWLESIASIEYSQFLEKTNYYESANVRLGNTLHRLENSRGRQDLVSSMDPDAPWRTGKSLEEDDKDDERNLVKKVFTLLRLGKKAEARSLCERCGQPWRAATLSGCDLFHDPNMDSFNGTQILDSQGNFNRDVWKSIAWKLSESEDYDDYERAMYAALCGNLRVLMRVCQNWHDAVWAHFKVLLDVAIEKEIRLFQHPRRPPQEELPSVYLAQEMAPAQIFATIASSASEAIRRGVDEPFHRIQALIIQADMPELIHYIHSTWVSGGASQRKEAIPYFRFLAHLTLLLRDLGIPGLDEQQCDEILLTYVRHLMEQRDMEVVANYAARLPHELQVDSFAHFLTNINDKTQRLRCLQLARDAGLDVASITKSVVHYVRAEDFLTETTIRSANVSLDISAMNEKRVTDPDAQKISAIEWLIFDPAQRVEALLQGNALMREFLLVNKLKAATDVLLKLPRDSLEVVSRVWHEEHGDEPVPEEVHNICLEYMAHNAFIESQHAYNSWSEHKFNTRPGDEERWKKVVREAQELAEMKLMNVVSFVEGWLVDRYPEATRLYPEEHEKRAREMEMLREEMIPKCMSLLCHVYTHSGQYHRCLELSVTIAHNPMLSDLFGKCKEKLRDLLDLFRLASLKILESSQSGDPLGFDD